MQSHRALAEQRFQAVLVSAFGAAGLLLTALGVYGVLSYGVNLRMREWGVRMALGSSRSQLIRRVLTGALRPLLAGGLVGSFGAFAVARWLQSLLYQSGQMSGVFLAGSLLLLTAVVLIGALPSAFRAGKSDPAVVLRGE